MNAKMLRSNLLALTAILASTLGAQQPATPRPMPLDIDAREYIMMPGDDIEVRFHYNPELNEKVVIRPDGRIAMSLIGEIAVAGLTPNQLARDLEGKYQNEITMPKVLVQIRSYAPRKVFVGGEVQHPGPLALQLNAKQTVLGALLEAGGLLRTADRKELTLIRRTAEGPVVKQIVLRAGKGIAPEAANFVIEPFDLILVNRSGIAKANQVIDQYIRQMSPALLNAGFNYLYNQNGSSLFPNLQ